LLANVLPTLFDDLVGGLWAIGIELKNELSGDFGFSEVDGGLVCHTVVFR
jgi:hypothetical protein